MKFLLPGSLLLATVLGTAVPRASQKIDYTGFKVLRLSLQKADHSIEAQIEKVAAHILNPGKSTLDVVVSPGSVAALKALVPESVVINEDLGASLAEEGELVSPDFSVSAGMLLVADSGCEY